MGNVNVGASSSRKSSQKKKKFGHEGGEGERERGGGPKIRPSVVEGRKWQLFGLFLGCGAEKQKKKSKIFPLAR